MSLPAKPLSYLQAAALVHARARALAPPQAHPTKQVPLLQVPLLQALGRVLAEPVVADRDQPPFARSTRDGFAARAEDLRRGSARVVGLLRAGELWQGASPAAGDCLEIMTGAPVPAELDCVAMVEHVAHSGDTITLVAGRTLAAGDNIVPRGAEARLGTTLVPAGTRLTAHGIAVAAACGYAIVSVFAKPKVAILSTGDELVDVADTPLPHQIRNSNSLTLAAQVLALGGEPVLAAPVADTAEALVEAIRKAAGQCSLLLLSGGVSMGKYDLVEPALAALGGSFHFTGVRMQPGKPVVFGELSSPALPFFGLPGNPVSTIVCFALFVAPVVAALAGERAYAPPFVQARLAAPLAAKAGLTRFLPARITYAVDGAVVQTIPWQGSGDLASTAQANCFLVSPEAASKISPDTAPGLGAGAPVTVLLA